jgi:hypothetical protein
MIRVKIFCPFDSSEKCKETYERVNHAAEIGFYGENQKIYITEHDDYTHAIIINTMMPDLKIPKKNVIGLAFEPVPFLNLTPEFVKYAMSHIGKYLIGDATGLPPVFVPHFGYLWYSPPLTEITMKQTQKVMSIVVSNKMFAPGHIYRHKLTQEIIKRGLPIDIYGNGSSNYSFHTVKGPFYDDIEPYRHYLFSICIENFKSGHYFSEKIITPLLHNCLPIYYGCATIDTYFDKGDVITLKGRVEHDIQLLIAILKNPLRYYRRTCTDKNKKTVNLIENLENLFSD